MTFEQTLHDVLEFQRTTFPASTPISKLRHLEKEIKELVDELYQAPEESMYKVEMEFADCFILLLGSAGMYGFTAQDILALIEKKMVINKGRKWGKPDENGVVLHIKEGDDE